MQVQKVDDIHEDLVSTSLIERLSKHQGVKCTINVEQFKVDGTLTNDRTLKAKLWSAIENNNLEAAKHILSHCKDLCITTFVTPIDSHIYNIWHHMSPEMGMLIATHPGQPKPLKLSAKDMINMMLAIWRPGTRMNEEVATAFVTNGYFDLSSPSDEHKQAKSISAGVS
ncbi:hypothetical protein SAMD00019534_113840 [Acytostelium subglobosum LB1]|uniref:hypothetical protein n=1 Tax=Acytostelium subglobosum LB1 TaxID=1410327 RepID=UPI0006451195|nr:hypothetical protein SAMD00019534_113840 [Acytostelium subglobosum LB1]GAM28208.1 hypothetical protein SAMD00019534_113840 [Acytostelium subglobosum LB1]|eukprot:XP_012748842.1 hypothetical protein SAMD00019534_113840 [Acytostelium subglobosum LB1]